MPRTGFASCAGNEAMGEGSTGNCTSIIATTQAVFEGFFAGIATQL